MRSSRKRVPEREEEKEWKLEEICCSTVGGPEEDSVEKRETTLRREKLQWNSLLEKREGETLSRGSYQE